MGASGEDILLSPRAREIIGPYSFECKNVERINLWSAYKQAEANAQHYHAVLIIKRNGEKPLAVVDAEHLVELFYEQGNENSKPTIPVTV